MALTACTKDADLTTPATPQPQVGKLAGKAAKSQLNKAVAAVRQATMQYHDPEAALADGFVDTKDCVAVPGLGGMGVHFVRFDRLDDVHDPLEPEVLVYEIKNNGTYQLVAIEYLHVGKTPPMFAGEIHYHPFAQPFADYALHVWAWKGNPSGMFADFNPNVSCP